MLKCVCLRGIPQTPSEKFLPSFFQKATQFLHNVTSKSVKKGQKSPQKARFCAFKKDKKINDKILQRTKKQYKIRQKMAVEKPVESVENLDKSIVLWQNVGSLRCKKERHFVCKKETKSRKNKTKKEAFFTPLFRYFPHFLLSTFQAKRAYFRRAK